MQSITRSIQRVCSKCGQPIKTVYKIGSMASVQVCTGCLLDEEACTCLGSLIDHAEFPPGVQDDAWRL